MFRNKSIDIHKFSMIPKTEIPRSVFDVQKTHKTTFDSGILIPVYCEEVLPGDSINLKMTAFGRLATPIFPIMDNLHLDSFFFFVPNRLVWNNWQKFMGEQVDPDDSISFTIPQQISPTGGYPIGSLQDHLGLPTVGQVDGSSTISHSALPLRGYQLIWNEWFRDENLQNHRQVDLDDGPDNDALYALARRGKRHDYFTSALPWPQKGDTAVSLPLGTTATVKTHDQNFPGLTANTMKFQYTNGTFPASALQMGSAQTSGVVFAHTPTIVGSSTGNLIPANLYADLTDATASTVSQLRQSFQIQKLLERDARGGTRYTEIVRSHFGVVSPDARLQRPEYLGGGSSRIEIDPVQQSSATSLTGSTTPLGALAAQGTLVARNHGFKQSFTEHGHIMGMVCVRADLTYQQGLRKMWSRSTRYDYYFPVFAHLGEQAILNKEIYADGTANDDLVFGYQERWAEYRHQPSEVTGLFRSTAAGTLDAWHLAQNFATVPTLGNDFIKETPPLERVLAVGAAANGAQIIFDSFFNIRLTRALPMYSVPGNIDRF